MPKFAVITGASSGIGAEFARQLSARGYNLLLVARRADRLDKLSNQLTSVCEIMTADLSKKSECLRLVNALENRRVDLFINNAGFGDCGPFLQTELDKDLDMISVNIRALHILTKKVGQKLYKQGFGALLNVGSCAGLMPAGPYMATYYATKAYVVSLTSALAQAAVAVGADGLMIETHNDPAKAKSDGAQSLTPDQFDDLMKTIKPELKFFDKTLN